MSLRSQDIYAQAMAPAALFVDQISGALDERGDRIRQDKLIADQRTEAERVRQDERAYNDKNRASDRQHAMDVLGMQRDWTVEDRADARVYAEQQQAAAFDKWLTQFLISNGVLDPSKANDPEAISAAAAELNPQKQRELQERRTLLGQITEIGAVIPIPEGVSLETASTEELRKAHAGMLRQSAQIAQQQRERQTREDVAATLSAQQLRDAEMRMQISPDELQVISARVAQKMGINPAKISRMDQKQRDAFMAAVQQEVENEQAMRMINVQQKQAAHSRQRGIPYFDGQGQPALPAELQFPADGTSDNGVRYLDPMSQGAPAPAAPPPMAAPGDVGSFEDFLAARQPNHLANTGMPAAAPDPAAVIGAPQAAPAGEVATRIVGRNTYTPGELVAEKLAALQRTVLGGGLQAPRAATEDEQAYWSPYD